MKKMISILVVMICLSTAFVSCGKNPTPDNKVYYTDVVPNGFKPDLKGGTIAVSDTTVALKPTWGQANGLASEREDNFIWQVVGCVLLILGIVFLLGGIIPGRAFSAIESIDPKFRGGLILVLLAGSLTSFKWQSAAIKWNNTKEVSKTQYDYYMNKDKSTVAIWDSLKNGCHIAWGPYDCWDKDNKRIK